MPQRWIDITDPTGARREILLSGLTRVGGADADVLVAGTGSDQLHFWDEPPRVLFIGAGPRPRFGDVAFDERELRPGDRIEWSGVLLEFGGEAGAADQASVEEVRVEQAGAVAAPFPSTIERRVAERIHAGLLIEAGAASRGDMRRWQQAVLENEFDADRCAREIVQSSGAVEEVRMLERSARLLRDFLMAPMTQGVRGASRRTRQAVRSGIAFVLAQGLALVVYSVIVAVAMLLLRLRGVGFDQLLDRILGRD